MCPYIVLFLAFPPAHLIQTLSICKKQTAVSHLSLISKSKLSQLKHKLQRSVGTYADP